jgi:ribonuclease-3
LLNSETALEQLLTRLDLCFENEETLHLALTHRSAVSDAPFASNERLEFLGDAVLGLVINEHLWREFPKYQEGQLAKGKSYIVSEQVLAEAARAIGLDRCIVLSPPEDTMGGRQRPSILSDAFEALIAAIYLELGLETAKRVILDTLHSAIDDFAENRHRRDYKSYLQEITQAKTHQTPTYTIAHESGRDHEKTFMAEVWLSGQRLGQGEGLSKKEAEQSAAQSALENLPPSLKP